MIRVVIYDDHEQRRNSLMQLIELTDNIQCINAYPDCTSVVEDMKQDRPDVVLMDIEMPGIDGITGVGLLKRQFPGIRVIIQTVYDDSDKIFAALQAGAEGYILKNTDAEKTLQSIEEVYKGGAFMTPSVALRVMKFFNSETTRQAETLTQKEKEVLKHLTEGNSYKMVADKMNISYYTVNSHIKKIYEKLHVHSLGEAVSLALKNKIV